MRRWPTGMGSWVISGLFVLVAVGCGDDSGNVALDPNSWSGMHVNEIQKDCTETVQCMNQMGQPLIDDPVNSCVEATAKLLESSTDKQAEFVSNNSRCAQFVVCQYLDCVITDATSTYGDMQQALIAQDCSAEVECQTVMGTPPADPNGAINTCIATNINVLNNFNPDMRFAYENSFATCSMLAACDFVNCFQF